MPDWPTPAPGIAAELNEILYAAQVSEVADARAAAGARRGGSDLPILVGGVVVGLAVIVVVSSVLRGEEERHSGAADGG